MVRAVYLARDGKFMEDESGDLIVEELPEPAPLVVEMPVFFGKGARLFLPTGESNEHGYIYREKDEIPT